MAKKYHVFILRGDCDPDGSVAKEFATAEEVQAFLLEEGEDDPEYVWVVYGERFGFKTQTKTVGFTLTGPP